MQELLRTNDPVLLSWAIDLLEAEGIDTLVLDAHTSVLEGSIGILPRRLMVHPDDLSRARYLVETSHPDRSGRG
jgi:hypothetical protein